VIQHVSVELREADGEAEVAFWALLGFAEVRPPDALARRTRWVQREGTQIHLMWADDPVVPPAAHVAVVCPDYEATLEGLRAAGRDPEPRTEHWGSPRSFVHSPAGHRVELMAGPPG